MTEPSGEPVPARFRRVHDELVARPIGETLRRDVPSALEHVLQRWITRASDLDRAVAQRVALRMDISFGHKVGTREAVHALAGLTGDELLDAVYLTLALHNGAESRYADRLEDLESALLDAGMAYTVARNGLSLVERVDETVTAAAEQAIAADSTAGAYLSNAWSAAYGYHPDPDTAYREAVRAVEQVACPLILAKQAAANKATLGTVIGELRNSGNTWSFLGLGTDDDVTPLVNLLWRLWEGQFSRHGGGQNSRSQTQEEAEAAVRLAVFLVGMLTSGALARR